LRTRDKVVAVPGNNEFSHMDLKSTNVIMVFNFLVYLVPFYVKAVARKAIRQVEIIHAKRYIVITLPSTPEASTLLLLHSNLCAVLSQLASHRT
jgi:hypothetical protein